jgi:hypothetical protein
MKRSHICLIAGLGSSILWPVNPWSAWARKLKSRFEGHYTAHGVIRRPDIVIWAVSADGSGEKKMFDTIIADHQKGLLDTVCGGGHSNGDRDWLRGAERLYARGIQIPYGFGIDMTLGEFGAEVFGNHRVYEEFHGVLETADFHPSFKQSGSVHRYHETKVGHTASANLQWVQDRIFDNITKVIK